MGTRLELRGRAQPAGGHLGQVLVAAAGEADKDELRVEYLAATDDEALEAFRRLAETEGIIPALEPSHALARAPELEGEVIVVCLSGRGDKDLDEALAHLK